MRKLYCAIWVVLAACAGSGERSADVRGAVRPATGGGSRGGAMKAPRAQPPKKVPKKKPAVTATKPVSRVPVTKPARKLTKEEQQLSSIAMDFSMTEDATDVLALLATTLPALAKEAKKLGMYRWGMTKAIEIKKDRLMGVLVQVTCMVKKRLPKKCRDDRDEEPPASCESFKPFSSCDRSKRPRQFVFSLTRPARGRPQVAVTRVKTRAFIDDEPIVGFAPWYAKKPVLFISYTLPEKESDEKSVQTSTKTEGPFTELYTFERGKLARKHVLIEGASYLSPGYEKSTTTKLSFAEGTKSKRLFVILETTTKLKTYDTGGEDEDNLRWHCSNHTVLFALTPKGAKWKKYAGGALKRLRKQEPALKLLLDDHKKTMKEECD